MIVIGTGIEYKIGEIVQGATGVSKGEYITQPLYIIREATEHEWRNSVRELGGDPTPFKPPAGSRFYEVSSD